MVASGTDHRRLVASVAVVAAPGCTISMVLANTLAWKAWQMSAMSATPSTPRLYCSDGTAPGALVRLERTGAEGPAGIDLDGQIAVGRLRHVLAELLVHPDDRVRRRQERRELELLGGRGLRGAREQDGGDTARQRMSEIDRHV